MPNGKPKLSYLASQKRVRCEISKKDTMASERPPADLMTRAKKKLESEKTSGGIEFYRLYEIRLNKAWKMLRSSSEAADFKIGVTLGSGAPTLEGVSISKGKSPNEIARLSIDTDVKTIKSWSPQFLKLYVTRLLKDHDIMDPVNPAQIKRLWFRAVSGNAVNKIPLIRIPRAGSGKGAHKKYFYILEEGDHRDITVVIENVKAAAHPKIWQKIKDNIWDIVDARNLRGDGAYEFLYDDLVRDLRSAQRGPEHFGMDMPLVLLAAMDTKYYSAAKAQIIGKSQEVKGASASPTVKPDRGSPATGAAAMVAHKKAKADAGQSTSAGEGSSGTPAGIPTNLPMLFVNISEKGMLATIDGFGAGGKQDQPEGVTADWVKDQLAKQNIAEVAYDPYLNAIIETLTSEEGDTSIVGLTIATGKEGITGVNPFLREVFREKPELDEEEDDNSDADVMNNQAKTFVCEGEMIAKIEYLTPSVDGIDVHGTAIPAPAAVKVDVKFSDGIMEKNGQEYFAKHDGSPEIDGFAIKMEKGLVHTGDVNITSGNIKFDGSAQVSGSIDHGGYIDITADLTVTGSVTGGRTFVGGNLVIAGGTNTAPEGYIKTKGNLSANFMENSAAYCGGDLTIEKGLVSCDIVVKGNVMAKEICAGSITVGGNITCLNLGKAGARTTLVYLGVDRLGQRCLETRTKRYDVLKAAAKDFKKQLRLLKSKTDAQKTEKHIEKQEELEKKNERILEILETAEYHFESAKSKLKYNQDGVIFVEGTLAAGTVIHIGKKFVKVSDSVIEVGISYRKATGISIVDLTELKERLSQEGKGVEKKAS